MREPFDLTGKVASTVGRLSAAACLVAGTAFAAGAVQAQAPAASAKRAAAQQAAKKAEAGEDGAESPAAKPATRKRDPGEAQRQVDNGVKQLQAGRAEQAIQSLNVAISAGNLPPAVMARALHQRGIAYRQTKKPAQAISDLTSALWLKGGLNEAERADAISQRSAAYREAGLPDQADENGRVAGAQPNSAAAAAPKAEAPRRTASRATTIEGESGSITIPAGPTASFAAAPSQAPAAAAPAAPNLFATLFGGAAKSAPAAPAPAEPPAARPARTEPSTSAWSSTVATPAAPAPGTARIATATTNAAPAARPAPVAPQAANPAAAGRFHARLGAFRTEAEAAAASTRIRSQFAASLGPRQPQVGTIQFGGTTIYHVRLGPYASAGEATAACAQMKSAEIDCTPVDR